MVMDTNNWRHPQVGEPAMDAGDWKSQLQPELRQRMVNKIMDILKRNFPCSGKERLQELTNIAVRFEEEIYTASTSQSDYVQRISVKMFVIETKSPNAMARSPDPGSFGMQPQVPSQRQSLSMPLSANQSQARQQLLSQDIKNNNPAAGVQRSAGLSSALPPSYGLTQTPIPSIAGQNPDMQNMSGTSQNSLGKSSGRGVPSNIFANSHRQMLGSQQVVPQQTIIPRQQQQRIMQQTSATNLSQNQLMGQQINAAEIEKQKQQQQEQQNNLLKLKRQKHQLQLKHQLGLLQQSKVQVQQQQQHQNASNLSLNLSQQSQPQASPDIGTFTNAADVGHQQTAGTVAQVQSLDIGTSGISASPLLVEFSIPDGTHVNALSTISGKSTVTEQPLERLIKAVKLISPHALSASVSDIGSVVSMTDRIGGPAPGNGSRSAVGEDLVAMTKCNQQARTVMIHDGTKRTRKMRRYTSAMPLGVVSSAGGVSDSFKELITSETSDLESPAASRIKRPRIEANHAVLEEVREINRQLINTVVHVSDEDVDPSAASVEGGERIIVKCSFDAVAFSPNFKSQYSSARVSPIQPLRLLVPTNYPKCSSPLLAKFPVEVSEKYEDLSVKAKTELSISLRSLPQPMSLGEIARTWDVCASAVISEHAQQSGGGSFSSKYGTWENCLSAA